MTFGIITISYERKTVLKLFLASIKRLRTEINLNFPVVCVGDAEHSGLCEAYDVHHIAQANHPATRKWNTGVDYMMNLGVTYCVILGSDDIVATNLATNLIAKMETGVDLVFIYSIYFYGGDGKYRGSLRKITSTQPLGVCRCIHRRVIEKVGKLWKKDTSWAMDGECMRNMRAYIKTHAHTDGVVVDVKTVDSLNKITMWMSRGATAENPNIFYNILGEEEKQILNEI
jgi:hypothetical protein